MLYSAPSECERVLLFMCAVLCGLTAYGKYMSQLLSITHVTSFSLEIAKSFMLYQLSYTFGTFNAVYVTFIFHDIRDSQTESDVSETLDSICV